MADEDQNLLESDPEQQPAEETAAAARPVFLPYWSGTG
jgi:hypothetical protein